MRILCVSDIVDRYLYNSDESRNINPDLIVSCGDLPRDYLEFLMSKFNVPLFFVQGNHDNYFPEVSLCGLHRSKFDFTSQHDYTKCFAGVNIDGKLVTFRGVTFVGFEGCNRYSDGPHQYTQEEMKMKVRKVYWKLFLRKTIFNLGVDVIVTHAPPYGIHDNTDIVHTGFKAFIDIMERFKPKYLIHGHTHIYDIRESKVSDYKGTKVINCYGYYVLDLP
ncbi:MAG: metallophosphoesterase [Brevinematia bacterium]